jgi:hypothetical protein
MAAGWLRRSGVDASRNGTAPGRLAGIGVPRPRSGQATLLPPANWMRATIQPTAAAVLVVAAPAGSAGRQAEAWSEQPTVQAHPLPGPVQMQIALAVPRVICLGSTQSSSAASKVSLHLRKLHFVDRLLRHVEYLHLCTNNASQPLELQALGWVVEMSCLQATTRPPHRLCKSSQVRACRRRVPCS